MNFKLNKSLDKNKLREQWNDEKVLAISPFLEESCANKLVNYINETQEDNWRWVTNYNHRKRHANDKEGGGMMTHHTDKLSEDKINDFNLNLNNQMRNGQYSVMYQQNKLFFPNRNVDQPSSKVFNQYKNFLNGDEVKSFLGYITEEKIKQLGYTGYSRYLPNSFLGIHNDIGSGELTGVLGLTKDWKLEDGGHLCYTTHDRKKITKIIQSDFNQFVLHYVPPKIGIPHFVSQVAPWANKPRVSHVCCYFTE
jgi:Rps23 Pro-64 3,4-dihydroxylase Tpa1-like proline 4-hydroxylase